MTRLALATAVFAIAPWLAAASAPCEPSTPALQAFAKRADGYNNPADGGGSMLTIVNNTYPAGQGEPINVILSGTSDAQVLVDSLDDGGFQNYMLSTFLAHECLGVHFGDTQSANLGDGDGNVTQVAVLRWDYGDPYVGSCKETFNGGLHLRYWQQNGTKAFFLAVSVEMDEAKGHDIVPDGYNLGRDELVGNVTQTSVESRNVTTASTFSGQTSYGNYTYQTDVTYVAGLLQNSSIGINHNITVEEDGYAAIDGLVAVLQVSIVSRPAGDTGATAASSSSSGAISLLPPAVAIVTLAAVAALW
ncbi:uncharacterized protein EHS24_002287 [Apiotrichum porosum]|uniref:Uncharacterized protein n=1 Tax=Apiotrichum porosum TaxID=105984 RepID=A0A427XI52_9TREE|nr:uncharacterized protein EHS24_002287 [Apiotrichum porosum]RSH78561.1 hypothetical protein EHS24_002287 [Apiotrichum porosum]